MPAKTNRPSKLPLRKPHQPPPLPARAEMDAAQRLTEGQIQLGQQLWYEPRLSRGNTVSCNSCHNLASYGVDNMPTSQG